MVVDLSLEAIRETDIEHFCVEIMKRLDIQRRNEHFCDVILEVGSSDDQARLKAHRIVNYVQRVRSFTTLLTVI